MKTDKTPRNYYALNWKPVYEFESVYKNFCDPEIEVATLLAFKKKHDRDKYVDRWHSAESIPASMARKLAKYIGVVYISRRDMKDDVMEH